jgi:hypothetical protein
MMINPVGLKLNTAAETTLIVHSRVKTSILQSRLNATDHATHQNLRQRRFAGTGAGSAKLNPRRVVQPYSRRDSVAIL